jgi:uncharacterized protein Usg
MSDQDFARQMAGWSLTTAEITYHMPDYRHLLQSFSISGPKISTGRSPRCG